MNNIVRLFITLLSKKKKKNTLQNKKKYIFTHIKIDKNRWIYTSYVNVLFPVNLNTAHEYVILLISMKSIEISK